jgi:nucleoside-diphosphate-sugar epimerase
MQERRLDDTVAAHPRFFCFGLGFSAMALARRLLAEGWRVAGTCRSEEKRAALAAEGIEAFRFERGVALPDGALAGATHILSSVPPDEAGDPVLDGCGGALAALPGVGWIGYLSTTGVYGDYRGAWVDETSPLRPSLERAWRRVAAEEGWRDLLRLHGSPVHVFRLAGIYGPGRSAVDNVQAGKAQRIVKWGQVFSRIHVEDVAQVVRASMERPDPGAVYNVCDDDPAPPHKVVEYACELLGVEPPPLVRYEEAQLSEMARSFWTDNKRVRNERIKRELGVILKFPDYKSGLRAIVGKW